MIYAGHTHTHTACATAAGRAARQPARSIPAAAATTPPRCWHRPAAAIKDARIADRLGIPTIRPRSLRHPCYEHFSYLLTYFTVCKYSSKFRQSGFRHIGVYSQSVVLSLFSLQSYDSIY